MKRVNIALAMILFGLLVIIELANIIHNTYKWGYEDARKLQRVRMTSFCENASEVTIFKSDTGLSIGCANPEADGH